MENGYLSKAVSHALDSGDIALVNTLISGNALAMVEHVELIGVLRQFEKIPEEQISSKPWLCVAHAWVQAYVDPTRGMDLVLRKAMESLAGVEDDSERQHLTSHLDAVWAYVAWLNGKAALALEFAREVLQHLPDDDWTTRTHVLNIEGLALQYENELPAAVPAFEAAVAAGQKTGRPFESFNAYSNWAFAEILQGHLKRAFSICQQVLALAEQSGLITKGLPVLAYAYATMSIVQCEWNQVDAAVASARQAVDLAEHWGQADTLHYSLTCLSQALQAAGDLEGALAANQRAMLLAINVSPWFVQISTNGEILINLAKGDITTAARQFKELELMANEQSKLGLFLSSQVALLNAQGRFTDTIDVIDQVLGKIERQGRIGFALTLMTTLAVALQAHREEERAIQVIGRCLAIAQREGYQRIFIEQGAPLHELLQAAMKCGLAVEYIQELLPAFKLPAAQPMLESPAAYPAPRKTPGTMMLEPLSEREIQVLRLLDSPLTSEDIGRELYISSNTVRTHIKNIYAKLGVNRRTEAVRLAKKIELI
jgi:LuxR family maltose regulon positive regulatory protein